MANANVKPMKRQGHSVAFNQTANSVMRGNNKPTFSAGAVMNNNVATSPVSARPQVSADATGARDAVTRGATGARDAVTMGTVGARDAIADRDSVGGTLADPVAKAAVKRTVQANETVSGNMDRLMDENSDYMRINQEKARRRMNSRGMDDTSVGVGAVREAAINSAMPIASQDANIYSQASQYNTQMENDFINSENQFGRTRFLQDDNQQHANQNREDVQHEYRSNREDDQYEARANREDSQYEAAQIREDSQYENRANREDQQFEAANIREDSQFENRSNREDNQAYGTNERLGQQDFQDQTREDNQSEARDTREDTQAHSDANREDVQSFQNQDREDNQEYNTSERTAQEQAAQDYATHMEGIDQRKLDDQQLHEIGVMDKELTQFNEKAMKDMDGELRKQYGTHAAGIQTDINRQITAIYSSNMTGPQQTAAIEEVRKNGRSQMEWLTESMDILNDFDMNLGDIDLSSLLLAGNEDVNGGGMKAAMENDYDNGEGSGSSGTGDEVEANKVKQREQIAQNEESIEHLETQLQTVPEPTYDGGGGQDNIAEVQAAEKANKVIQDEIDGIKQENVGLNSTSYVPDDNKGDPNAYPQTNAVPDTQTEDEARAAAMGIDLTNASDNDQNTTSSIASPIDAKPAGPSKKASSGRGGFMGRRGRKKSGSTRKRFSSNTVK